MGSSECTQWWKIVAVGAACLGGGFAIGTFLLAPQQQQQPPPLPQPLDPSPPPCSNGKRDTLEVDLLAQIMDKFKMVLVVRNDLKMGRGKIAAQCSHASLGLYKELYDRAPLALQRWEACGPAQVVTKVESEEELLLLQSKAEVLKLPTHITIDAGKTQIAPDSRTVMSILGPIDLIDEVTGGLRLL